MKRIYLLMTILLLSVGAGCSRHAVPVVQSSQARKSQQARSRNNAIIVYAQTLAYQVDKGTDHIRTLKRPYATLAKIERAIGKADEVRDDKAYWRVDHSPDADTVLRVTFDAEDHGAWLVQIDYDEANAGALPAINDLVPGDPNAHLRKEYIGRTSDTYACDAITDLHREPTDFDGTAGITTTPAPTDKETAQ